MCVLQQSWCLVESWLQLQYCSSELLKVLNACVQMFCFLAFSFFRVVEFARNMLPLCLISVNFDRTPCNICNNAVSLYFFGQKIAIFRFVNNGPKATSYGTRNWNPKLPFQFRKSVSEIIFGCSSYGVVGEFMEVSWRCR